MLVKEQDYWNFGYNVFGPFLNGFVSWLHEKCRHLQPKKIFFFSRDGYIMQKAFCFYEKIYNSSFSHEYVYFSRNSLRRALIWDCSSYEEAISYLTKERFFLFAEIAAYFGVEKCECSEFLKQNKILWHERIAFSSLKNNEIIRHFFYSYKKIIQERSRAQYENILSYFKQIGLDGKVVIVDIGWHGGMQFYLERLLEKANVASEITGLYIGINPTYNLKGAALGYLFNAENSKYSKDVLCFLGVFERLFQSLEGSTDNYYMQNGIIVPVLKPYEYENDLQIQQYIRCLQNGALIFVEKFADDSTKKSYMPLLKFGKNPTNEQVRLFKFFYTADGGKFFCVPQKKIYQYSLKEYITDLGRSTWKTGFLKGSFKLPLPYFWIYKLLKK